MKFDAVVGNPPYQQSSNDDRNTSRDIPIYNFFVLAAEKLNPNYVSMIIPSRWMASGLGLTSFRKEMLEDKQIRKLYDYPISSDVFPSVEIKGGVCYFIWEKDSSDLCEVYTMRNGEIIGPCKRDLAEYDVFVRDSRAVDILHKVLSIKEKSIIDILSVDKEFGWTSNFEGFHHNYTEGLIPLYYNRKGKRLIGWIEREKIKKSRHLIDKWKVLIPEAGSDGGQKIPDPVVGSCMVAPSPSVCTQTYLFLYCDSKMEAENIQSYFKTKFFRFLVSLRKITQHATRSTYTWVPTQDFSKSWTDAELYEKYALTKEEITFIESMIKPME